MIARAPYLFLLLILLPDLYLDYRYWRHRFSTSRRLLYWLPSIGMTAYTLILMYEKNFVPDNPTLLYIYLFLLGFIVIPKCVFTLCSIAGFAMSRLLHRRRNYGNLIGLCCTPVIWYILIYGAFTGFEQLDVSRQTYVSPELPKAFNGYRIVLFSDAHVGSYTGSRQWVLQKAVDSINALRPDMIVFTGDLQNIHPQELYEHMDILSSLKAKDGVFSVLGNHDYAAYVSCSDIQKVANCRETVSLEKQMGWTLLSNEHRIVERGKARLVIAGMENDGDGKRFPQLGDIKKALNGVEPANGKGQGDFIILLEHDPSAWQRKIIPDGRAQLTLSGHTHNAQFSVFGWSPIRMTGKEVNGWYAQGRQSLFVTSGLGGLIPFRFGATGEIVLITLQSN